MLGAVVVVGPAVAPDAEAIRGALAALRPHCHRLAVFGRTEQFDNLHHPLPADASELHALAAVLRQAGREHAAVMPADLLRPSAELIRYMIEVSGSFEVVAPERHDGSVQPLLALYHPKLLRRIEGLITAGERDISALLETATIRRITAEEVAKFGEPELLLDRRG